MGEGHDHHQYQFDYQDAPPVLRRNRRKLAIAGEIVEVQGGHIVRSTGRKDRHSKVCTAKGPRDRRVRLSAHTAIQFYDVQDRLGYDRPSKAVDWLIMNAKAAIDELAELPPWHPTATVPSPSPGQETQLPETKDSTRNTSRVDEFGSSCAYTFDGSAGLLRSSSLQYSDTVADTIKSFFPNQQDLRLSLQSIHDPIPQTPEQALFNTVQANWQQQNATMAPSPWSLAVPTSPGGNQFFTQREPLQSSNNTVSALGLHRQRSAPPGLSTTGGFRSGESSGFLIPARIQGEDVHHHGLSDMPFSASSASHH